MNRESMIATVRPFYDHALTVNPNHSPADVLGALLADDFLSINSQEQKPKAALIKQVGFFWTLIPDLLWEPVDFVVEGNKVVVRSVASGTPKGNFMGVPLDGSRSFKIDTTDIHEIVDGRVVRAYHLEDWATGMKQLTGR